MTGRGRLGRRLHPEDRNALAEELLAQVLELGRRDRPQALQLLLRRARVFGPAWTQGSWLGRRLVEVLRELSAAPGEASGQPPAIASVAWAEVGDLGDLVAAARAGKGEIVSVGAGAARHLEGDAVAEAEAIAALWRRPRLALALLGEPPPFLVRSELVVQADRLRGGGGVERDALVAVLVETAGSLGLEVERF